MSTPARVGSYLAGLALAFTAALGLGALVGPLGDVPQHTQAP